MAHPRPRDWDNPLLIVMIYNSRFPEGYFKARELEQNQAKWESKHITHYRFVVDLPIFDLTAGQTSGSPKYRKRNLEDQNASILKRTDDDNPWDPHNSFCIVYQTTKTLLQN